MIVLKNKENIVRLSSTMMELKVITFTR